MMLHLAFIATAWANGQTTHIWISRHALDYLPEGELRDLLTREDLLPMLVHGTMFPDGGYPLGHPYGEAAHWEPFQGRYLAWIRDNYGAPWTDEAAQHVAFLMGLASHGMADQVFDAHYLDRSQHYDEEGWASGASMDEATDVVWASLTGAQEVPDRWVPDTVLVELFVDQGIEVDAATLDDGQDLLEAAVGLVGLLGQNADSVAAYEAQFPWATAHLQDEAVPGQPACEAEVIARYWEDLWARLNEQQAPRDVLASWPESGAYGQPTDSTSVESRVSVAFARGRYSADVTPDRFAVRGSDGAEYAVDTWLYYGDNSHVVHLLPQEDWPADEDFTVTVLAGLPANDGSAVAEDFTFAFSTRTPPAAEDTGAVEEAEEGAEEPAGCGCQGAPKGGWLPALLAAISLRRGRSASPRSASSGPCRPWRAGRRNSRS